MEMLEIDTFYQAKGNHKWYFSDGVEACGPFDTEHEVRIAAALYDFYMWRYDFHQGEKTVIYDPNRRQRGSESEGRELSSKTAIPHP